MKNSFYTLCALCWGTVALAQHYQVDTLYKTGPLDKRINVVILGDGFTREEMPKFASEAKKFTDFFRSFEPYDRYRAYFNFFAIGTPSKESGITNPGTASDAYPDQPVEMKDTFYGVSFGENIHRLLYVTKTDAYQDILVEHLPDYDLVVILANTSYFGGAAGAVGAAGSAAIFSLQENANSVGVHEIGHTFADLADEYWQYPYGLYSREGPNITKDSTETTVKWKNWLDYPSIGVYRHGLVGNAAEWYKPSSGSCLMEVMGKDYCVVCREAIVESILERVTQVEHVEPDTISEINMDQEVVFKLDLLKPDPNSLETEWHLNGVRISRNNDKLVLTPDQVPDGSILTATIFDSTAMSRRVGMRKVREKVIRWTLKSVVPGIFSIVASADTVCAGDSIALTAYGCAGTVSWSTGQAGKEIFVKPGTGATYKAACKTAGMPALMFDIAITVLPVPVAIASNGGPYTVGQTVQLSASGGTAYQWSGPRRFAANTPIATIPDATIHSAGTYEVKVTGENGCSKIAQTEVRVEPVLSLSHEEVWLTVFPNPARDRVHVKTVLPGNSRITLYDPEGRVMFSKLFNMDHDIPVNFQPGIYLYRFRNGNREVSGRMVVE